ncbi:MAG: hypothetical protein JXA95_13380 [Spirochaetales bacterium]|nr:hypothetical protein [Spirochaetales bacterium]
MKKQLTCLFGLFILFPLLPQDRLSGVLEHYLNGGNRDSNNPYNYTSLELGWERVLSPDLTLFATVSGDMDWSFPENSSAVTGNISRLSLRYESAPWTLEGGRMKFADSTGYIMNLNLDGAVMSYPLTDTVTLRGGIGYSGLTFDHATALVKTSEESAEDRLVSPSRLVWFARGNYRNEKGLEGNAHFYGQAGFGGNEDPLFLSYAGAYGSLARGDFVYKADYTLEGGSVGSTYGGEIYNNYLLAHLIYGEVGYYPSSLRDRGVKGVLSAFFTSGDSYDDREQNIPGSATTVEPDRFSTLFIPISRSVIGSQLGDQPGNLAFVRLEGGFIPLKTAYQKNLLGAGLLSTVYLRTANGPIQAAGLSSASNSTYLGTEFNAKLTFRPFSDLGLSVDNQFFFPNTSTGGTFEGSRENLEYTLELVLTFSF